MRLNSGVITPLSFLKTKACKLPIRALLGISAISLFSSVTPRIQAGYFITNTPMTGPRYGQTTTLLPNGKVLAAAGASIGADNFLDAMSSAEVYDPVTSRWTITGSLKTARFMHTATLLLNGKVLIAGGADINNNSISSSELYDPVMGAWTNTGSLTITRDNHTATLLPNGKILVVGGQSTSAANIKSAELYDPGTGKWTATGSMATNRYSHTATLLPNGKVLVVGGVNSSPYVTPLTAEIYDPANGTWTAAGSLHVGRYYHTATLLPNGQVLVTGGVTLSNFNNVLLSSAEVFNPATTTWTFTTTSMSSGRQHQAANLLPSGKVLITGGQGTGGGILTNAELFDWTTGSWTVVASNMNAPHYMHTSTVLPNGRLLIAGGGTSGFTVSAITELYDSANGSWTNTGTLHTARSLCVSSLLTNGMFLEAGGTGASGVQTSTETYDPVGGTWATNGPLNFARVYGTGTLLPNGKVLAAGGYNGHPLASAEIYDSGTGLWTNTGSLIVARAQHTATLLADGKVLVAGGLSDPILGPYYGSSEIYNFVTGQWTSGSTMNIPRAGHTATVLANGQVLVVGGRDANSQSLTNVELYDPAAGKWFQTGSLNVGRAVHTATLLPNGKVLVAGGNHSNGGPSPLSSVEIYDPVIGTWSFTGSLTNARYGHKATLLPNGKVLVAGGFSGGTNFLSSAELYDPNTGTWTLAQSMSVGRNGPMGGLLLNGKILICGGQTNGVNLASAELYDVGLGFSNTWQPQITTITSLVNLGGMVSIAGSQFRGISEGANGGTEDSASDIPVVQLSSLANEQSLFLSCSNWSSTSFASLPVTNFPPGYALATVFVNGTPGTSSIVNVSVPTVLPTKITGFKKLNNGTTQFGFTNNINALIAVQSATNFALNSTNWTALGAAVEVSPGHFQFTDSNAPSVGNRFYRLGAP